MLTNQDNTEYRRPMRNRGEKKDRFLLLRNILNIIFMVCALVGVIVYLKWDSDKGIIIILASMLVKFVECAFRFLK